MTDARTRLGSVLPSARARHAPGTARFVSSVHSLDRPTAHTTGRHIDGPPLSLRVNCVRPYVGIMERAKCTMETVNSAEALS